MTQREIDNARASLPRQWSECSDAEKRLSRELDCRNMINSCLTYGSIKTFWEECPWRFGDKSYAAPYIRDLGMERVKEIAADQEADFHNRATVKSCVYTDSEGLTYNSVIWRE